MAGETTKEEQWHFRTGTVVICVGSSSKIHVQEYDMRLPCSVLPSFMYSLKSRLSNANCVNRHRGSVG